MNLEHHGGVSRKRLAAARVVLGLQSRILWFRQKPQRPMHDGLRVRLKSVVTISRCLSVQYGWLILTREKLEYRPWGWMRWMNPLAWFISHKPLEIGLTEVASVECRSALRSWGGAALLQPSVVIRMHNGRWYAFYSYYAEPIKRIIEHWVERKRHSN